MYTLTQERTTMKQPLMYVNNNITVVITSSSSFFLCRLMNCFLCSSDSSDSFTSNSLNTFAEFSYFSFSSFVCNFHLSDARFFSLRKSDPYIHLQILKYCAIKLENILTWRAKFLNVIL